MGQGLPCGPGPSLLPAGWHTRGSERHRSALRSTRPRPGQASVTPKMPADAAARFGSLLDSTRVAPTEAAMTLTTRERVLHDSCLTGGGSSDTAGSSRQSSVRPAAVSRTRGSLGSPATAPIRVPVCDLASNFLFGGRFGSLATSPTGAGSSPTLQEATTQCFPETDSSVTWSRLSLPPSLVSGAATSAPRSIWVLAVFKDQLESRDLQAQQD